MPDKALLDPITENDVPKVDNAIAVGEDLKFQERWWTFERLAWAFFGLILIADVMGAFGEGWLAKARINQPGSGMMVNYVRVARAGTPAKIEVQFGPDAVSDGKVRLYASNTLVKDLGAQRVIPQPETSAVVADGILYTFPATNPPGEVDFELQPGTPRISHFRLQLPGKPMIDARIVVIP